LILSGLVATSYEATDLSPGSAYFVRITSVAADGTNNTFEQVFQTAAAAEGARTIDGTLRPCPTLHIDGQGR